MDVSVDEIVKSMGSQIVIAPYTSVHVAPDAVVTDTAPAAASFADTGAISGGMHESVEAPAAAPAEGSFVGFQGLKVLSRGPSLQDQGQEELFDTSKTTLN